MRRQLPFIAVAAVVATLLTGGLVYSTRTLVATLEREALSRQQNRAMELASRLDAQLQLSSQIADSTATVIAPLRSPAAIEDLLHKMLRSTSPEFVYGIGVWFEPHALDAARRYYGPYVHRDQGAGSVLTFEWSTAAYDYPSQPWYLLGRRTGAQPAFSEPYFDVDHVYMTTTRSFFDERGAALGVVSVDLIMPQLRDIVARANVSREEAAFVTTREGRLFAHPDELRLLAWARAQGRAPNTLLDLTVGDLASYDATNGHPRKRVEHEAVVARSGWKVHVTSDPDALFTEGIRTQWAAAGLGVLLWAALLAGTTAHLKRQQARELSREVESRLKVEQSLRENVRQRDEFLALAAHELRTPLTSVVARLQIMKRILARKQLLDGSHLDAALTAAQRLRALVDDLLDMSRVNTDRLPIHPEPVSLSTIVRQAAAVAQASGTTHELKIDLPPEDVEVFGDPVRLEQVVTNLVSNAIKYSPEGGVVQITLDQRADEAVLSVHDEGIGIPSAELPHVFDRYFRASNAPPSSFPGLGLGLYLCRDIVLRHGGRIWIESGEGAGSTVQIALPLLESVSAFPGDSNVSRTMQIAAEQPARPSRASGG